MSRADVSTGLSTRRRNIAKQQAHAINRLPRGVFVTSVRAGELEQFRYADLTMSMKRTLRCAGILLPVGYVRNHTDRLNPGQERIWMVEGVVHDYAAEVVDSLNSPCGCGHSGIRNLGDNQYTCTTDDCDVLVSREEVKQQ
jgi:hypothetical protein